MPKPPLTVEAILAWADDFNDRRGRYPHENDGRIKQADLTWAAVSLGLKRGYRGLPGGTTLAQLLWDRRGVRNKTHPPRLSIAQILRWADEHHRSTGHWPTHETGPIPNTPDETWLAVECALRDGARGLRGRSSLAQLLAARRRVRNHMALPPLSHELILAWADRHHARTGRWPSSWCGSVTGAPGESWPSVDMALLVGRRGLPPGSSIARLLAAHRGVLHPDDLPAFSRKQILAWADAHKARTGKWPTEDSGPIAEAPDETWRVVNSALARGNRGLPGGDTLPRLLARCRGKRNTGDLPPLTREQVLRWLRAHYRRCGRWPANRSGAIPGQAGETWLTVDNALKRGKRGLPGGSSLGQLVAQLKSSNGMVRAGGT